MTKIGKNVRSCHLLNWGTTYRVWLERVTETTKNFIWSVQSLSSKTTVKMSALLYISYRPSSQSFSFHLLYIYTRVIILFPFFTSVCSCNLPSPLHFLLSVPSILYPSVITLFASFFELLFNLTFILYFCPLSFLSSLSSSLLSSFFIPITSFTILRPRCCLIFLVYFVYFIIFLFQLLSLIPLYF